MALIFTDPNTAGPFTSFQIKDVTLKVFRLTNTNFATTNVDTLVGALPADSSIVRISTWVKTALSGNGVTLPTISLGTTSAGTDFLSALAVTNTTGTYATASPVTGIMQAYNPPYTQDIRLYVRGGATTGNPTAGEIYLLVEYVR